MASPSSPRKRISRPIGSPPLGSPPRVSPRVVYKTKKVEFDDQPVSPPPPVDGSLPPLLENIKLYWDDAARVLSDPRYGLPVWVLPLLATLLGLWAFFYIFIPFLHLLPWCKLPGFKSFSRCHDEPDYGLVPFRLENGDDVELEKGQFLSVTELTEPLSQLENLSTVYKLILLRYGFLNLQIYIAPLQATFLQCSFPKKDQVKLIQEQITKAGNAIYESRDFTSETLRTWHTRSEALSKNLKRARPYGLGNLFGFSSDAHSWDLVASLWTDYYNNLQDDINSFRHSLSGIERKITDVKNEAANAQVDFLKCYEDPGAGENWRDRKLIDMILDKIQKYDKDAQSTIRTLDDSLSNFSLKANHVLERLEKSKEASDDPKTIVDARGLAKGKSIDKQLKALSWKTQLAKRLFLGLLNHESKLVGKLTRAKDDAVAKVEVLEREWDKIPRFW